MLSEPLTASPPLYVQDTCVEIEALQSQPAPVGVPMMSPANKDESVTWMIWPGDRAAFSLVTVSVKLCAEPAGQLPFDDAVLLSPTL